VGVRVVGGKPERESDDGVQRAAQDAA